MEEQKKEIKMNVEKDVVSKENQQPSFEELYKAYMDLAHKHQMAIQRLQQADKYIQTFNRLDYLLKILEVQNTCKTGLVFHDEFYYRCVSEVEEIMTVPEEANEETSEEN